MFCKFRNHYNDTHSIKTQLEIIFFMIDDSILYINSVSNSCNISIFFLNKSRTKGFSLHCIMITQRSLDLIGIILNPNDQKHVCISLQIDLIYKPNFCTPQPGRHRHRINTTPSTTTAQHNQPNQQQHNRLDNSPPTSSTHLAQRQQSTPPRHISKPTHKHQTYWADAHADQTKQIVSTVVKYKPYTILFHLSIKVILSFEIWKMRAVWVCDCRACAYWV